MSRTFNLPPVELTTMDVDAPVAAALRAQFLLERLVCPIVMQPDRWRSPSPTLPTRPRLMRPSAPRAKKLRCAWRRRARSPSKFFKPRLVGVMPSGEKIERRSISSKPRSARPRTTASCSQTRR